MAERRSQNKLPDTDTSSPPSRSKWGVGGLGTVLVLVVNVLSVEDKTKLILTALSPVVAVWLVDVFQKVGRWWGEVIRRNEWQRQYAALETNLIRAIKDTETSPEHRKELVLELEALQKKWLKESKDVLERLAVKPDKERSAAA
jgi:hypothetical protein